VSGKEELHQLVDRLPADQVQAARKILGDLCGEPGFGSNQVPPERPIEDILRELAAGIPQEEWDRLPADLSDHPDHYLYGTPKR
jgi:hypothetical protein